MPLIPMERATAYRGIDDAFSLSKTGSLLARIFANGDGYTDLGEYDSANSTIAIEKEDIFSVRTVERVKIGSRVTSSALSGSLVLQQESPITRLIANMSGADSLFAQQVAADVVQEFDKVSEGDVLFVSHKRLTAATVTGVGLNDAVVNYVLGTNFQIDGPAGSVQILSHPAAVAATRGKAKVKVKFSAEAIVGMAAIGMLSKTELLGSLIFRGMNKRGYRELVELWNVAFTVDGERNWANNSADTQTITINWEARPDPTKPAEFQFGRILDLTELSAA